MASRAKPWNGDEVAGDGLDDEAESKTDMTEATVNETVTKSVNNSAVVFVDKDWREHADMTEGGCERLLRRCMGELFEEVERAITKYLLASYQ